MPSPEPASPTRGEPAVSSDATATREQPAVAPDASTARRISREDVAYVARLALLDLSEEELDRFTGQLAAVLEHAEDVAALDLAAVPPTAHPLPLRNVFRADEPATPLDRAEVLAQAPAAEDGRFRVPSILGEEP
jgi:aspartyl-tRNA(Asn)/glutamyl-tRNA(Gln) amidotransferase subunit C